MSGISLIYPAVLDKNLEKDQIGFKLSEPNKLYFCYIHTSTMSFNKHVISATDMPRVLRGATVVKFGSAADNVLVWKLQGCIRE